MKFKFITILMIFQIFSFCANNYIFAQEPEKINDADNIESENIEEYMEEAMQEIDFYSLEELLDVQVEVASLFAEDELVVGSTVSSIAPLQWKKRGARRLTDAIENETSIINFTTALGYLTTAIRGYSRDAIVTKGVATLIDGIPIVSLNNGTNDTLPNWGLGTLNGIEIIKGPGSAIYGSDAFHGVIALKTFESDKDLYQVEAAGAYPLYADCNFKISQGFGNIFRINAAASYNQQIVSEDNEYKFDTKEKSELLPSFLPPSINSYQPAVSGTGKYENKYKTITGILKVGINPLDRFKINLNGYIVNNKFLNFPGFKEALFIQLNDKDHSSQDSSIYIGRGDIEYKFSNDISIEAKGYYYHWPSVFKFNTHFEGDSSQWEFHENRNSFDLIIKQPDNPINLQWLIAFSRTEIKVTKAEIRSFDSEGNAYQGKDYLPFANKSREIYSVYAQAKWEVLENFIYVLIGGRIDGYSDAGTQITPRSGLIFLPTFP